MSDVAIQVEGLSKRYRIGTAKQQYGVFREQLAALVTAPLRFRKNQPEPENEFWALSDVSFDVRHGEVMGVIGRNGAGKSTLLKILSQITEPTRGRAVLHGRVGSLLEVGTGFHPELTGRENVYLNGAILGMKKSEIDRRFDEIIEFAEIQEFLDTPVKHYSSGMYTRLAFSVAAHLEPEILIVDEVLAVGDAAFQKKSLGKMSTVAREGRTVLFVSHNMAAIENLCQRVLVLSAGRSVCDADAPSAVNEYLAMSHTQTAGESRIDGSDREGSGAIRFQEVRFFDDASGALLPELRAGQRVRFQLTYQVVDPQCIGKRLNVGLGFLDDFGQFKFAVNNLAVGFSLTVTDRGVVEGVISRFPLSPGVYFCFIHSGVGGVKADHVPHAIRIDVLGGDFYGTGKLPAQNRRGVYVPYEWIR